MFATNMISKSFIQLFALLSTVYAWNVTYEPAQLEEFRKYQERSIIVRIEKGDADPPGDIILPFSAWCEDTLYCEVKKAPSNVSLTEENDFIGTAEVHIRANFLGFSQMNVTVGNRSIEAYQLRLLRSEWELKVSFVFTCVLSVFITCITFFMGTQLEMGRILGIMKRPIGPMTGFVCQFLLMPLVGFTIATFGLRDDQLTLKLALFAASTCPGGGKSSFWTIIYGGNLDLSVTMTFTQTIAAMVMMPFWILTLGKSFTSSRVAIPFGALIEGLAVLIVPSSLGMLFVYYRPKTVERFRRWIKVATWCATVIFTVTGLYANYYIFFLFTWRIIICGMMLPWSGYIVAYTTATLFRQEWKDRITIAIETGVQNVGVAVILMMWCLPEPEVDISLVILFVIILSTDKPLIALYFIRKCYKRYNKDKLTPEEPNSKPLRIEGKSPDSAISLDFPTEKDKHKQIA